IANRRIRRSGGLGVKTILLNSWPSCLRNTAPIQLVAYLGVTGSAPCGTCQGCSSSARRPALIIGSPSPRRRASASSATRYTTMPRRGPAGRKGPATPRPPRVCAPVHDDAAAGTVGAEGASYHQLAFLRLALHIREVLRLQPL